MTFVAPAHVLGQLLAGRAAAGPLRLMVEPRVHGAEPDRRVAVGHQLAEDLLGRAFDRLHDGRRGLPALLCLMDVAYGRNR
jgi:hypothetical protein